MGSGTVTHHRRPDQPGTDPSGHDRPDYPHPSSAAVTRVMKGNRRTDTKPELRLRTELHRRGLRYRKQQLILLPHLRVRPDISFPRVKVAVFIDGCFWHGCALHGTSPRVNTSYWGPKLQRNRDRDPLVRSGLEDAGWTVVRVWEHENVTAAANEIVAVLSRLRSGCGPD